MTGQKWWRCIYAERFGRIEKRQDIGRGARRSALNVSVQTTLD